MIERAENHKDDIESQYMDTMRQIGVDFCTKFNPQGNFDMWGNPDGDMLLMYTANIPSLWLTVVIDGDIRWDTVEEFLSFIEDSENYIIQLNKKFDK